MKDDMYRPLWGDAVDNMLIRDDQTVFTIALYKKAASRGVPVSDKDDRILEFIDRSLVKRRRTGGTHHEAIAEKKEKKWTAFDKRENVHWPILVDIAVIQWKIWSQANKISGAAGDPLREEEYAAGRPTILVSKWYCAMSEITSISGCNRPPVAGSAGGVALDETIEGAEKRFRETILEFIGNDPWLKDCPPPTP